MEGWLHLIYVSERSFWLPAAWGRLVWGQKGSRERRFPVQEADGGREQTVEVERRGLGKDWVLEMGRGLHSGYNG